VGLLSSAASERVGPALLEIEPTSVGRILRPLTQEDNLLGERVDP